ncbi:Uncharacterised protein [Actinobacillus equuli]|nr:Uncharacterised protein [Actinobacillus equuli]
MLAPTAAQAQTQQAATAAQPQAVEKILQIVHRLQWQRLRALVVKLIRF